MTEIELEKKSCVCVCADVDLPYSHTVRAASQKKLHCQPSKKKKFPYKIWIKVYIEIVSNAIGFSAQHTRDGFSPLSMHKL